jgi:hypothetical protein
MVIRTIKAPPLLGHIYPAKNFSDLSHAPYSASQRLWANNTEMFRLEQRSFPSCQPRIIVLGMKQVRYDIRYVHISWNTKAELLKTEALS